MRDLLLTKWALMTAGGNFAAACALAYLDRGADWFWSESIIPGLAGFLELPENDVLNTLEELEAKGLVESRINFENRRVWRLKNCDHE